MTNVTKIKLEDTKNPGALAWYTDKLISYLGTNITEDMENDPVYGELVGGRLNMTGEDTPYGDLVCSAWFWDNLFSNGIKYGSMVAVIAINVILKKLLKRFVDWEKHSSRTDEERSLLIKLFLAQLFNTAILILIVNWNLNSFTASGYFDLNLSEFPIFTGSYSNFSSDWYLGVGITLIVTMILFIIQINAGPIVQYCTSGLAIWYDRYFGCKKSLTRKKTQADLYKLHAGPGFQLVQRYSAHLTMIFVVLAYSSGLPVLVLVAFGYFFISFVVDKFMFLRLYATPPMYDGKVASTVAYYLPLALFLHLLFGAWMLGNPKIFQSSDTLTQALEKSAELAAQNNNGTAVDPAVNDGINSVIGSTSEYFMIIYSYFTASGTEAALTLRNCFTNIPHIMLLFALYVVWVVWHYILSPLLHPFLRVLKCCRKVQPLQGNPEYFESLPLAFTKKALVTGSCKPELRTKYAESLGSRIQEMTEFQGSPKQFDDGESRNMEGLPTYDINENIEYKGNMLDLLWILS